MKIRRISMALVAAASLLCLSSGLTAQDSHKGLSNKGQNKSSMQAEVGKPAPNFELKDAAGKTYKLSDYDGKMVVLQWINPGCPVCRRCMDKGLVAGMLKELKATDKDLVYLTINSTNYAEPSDGIDYLKKHEIKAPALNDFDGKVGRLYGAKTTPHLFVIDTKGILRYTGAIDDDKRGSKGDDATNYAVSAVKQIVAGETVSPDRTQPYGCSVKYKK